MRGSVDDEVDVNVIVIVNVDVDVYDYDYVYDLKPLPHGTIARSNNPRLHLQHFGRLHKILVKAA